MGFVKNRTVEKDNSGARNAGIGFLLNPLSGIESTEQRPLKTDSTVRLFV